MFSLKHVVRFLALAIVLSGTVGAAANADARPAEPSADRVGAKTASQGATKVAAAKPAKARLGAGRGTSAKLARKAAARRAAMELDDSVGDSLVLRSASALILDQRSGEVLYEKNATQVAPIASITKLMTSMVVLDAALDLNEIIVIEKADIDLAKGSHSRLRVGSRLTREHVMLLALMSSENRAAHALGRTYPGGLEAFVEAMNRKAEALGLEQTHFVDPTGLSSQNVSTAQDLARMVTAAHGYSLIRELSTTPLAYVDVGYRRPMGYSNTNRLVQSPSWEIGLSKTGYISEAGKCLVMQAWLAGRPTVLVLLDSNGRLTRIGDANRIKRWLENSGTLAANATPRA